MEKTRIFDKRRKDFFIIDDAYLNGYAKLCGWKATLVYLALCRHSGKNQSCFPGIETMATKLAISTDSIKRGIKILVDWNIVKVSRAKRENGTWKNNFYVLLDKSVWKEKPVHSADSPMDEE